MRCPNCDSQIADNSKYCNVCGNSIGSTPPKYIPPQSKKKNISCSGLITAFIVVGFVMFLLSSIGKNEPSKTSPPTTTAATASNSNNDSQKNELINSLLNIAKTTFGKDVEVFYLAGIDVYSVRVWREDYANVANSDNKESWQKAVEQAILVEKTLRQTVKSVDSDASLSLSYSTNQEHEDNLLLITDGEIIYDIQNIKPSETTTPEETPASTTTTEKEVVWLNKNLGLALISDVYAEYDEFSTTIAGIVYNASNRDYSYVQISYSLYDSGGHKIGTAFDNIAGLKSKESWKFEAIDIVPAPQYKFESIEAY